MKDAEAQGNTPAPTPRTDMFVDDHLHAWPRWDWQDHASAFANWARDLERELLSAQAALTSAQAALAAKDAEIAHIKSKADECWGAANYRLKYLACLFRALGRPDDETIESNVSAAAEQIRELITRAEKAEAVFPTEDPDGKPYHHDPKKALAAKLALAEGDGPVSDTTAKAYVEAYATTPRSSLEIEAALLAADRLGHEDRYSPLAILADVVHYMRAECDQLRAEVEKLRQERAEWMPIYRRDYGHDWDKRTKYEGF